jgi:hypothetical protein
VRITNEIPLVCAAIFVLDSCSAGAAKIALTLAWGAHLAERDGYDQAVVIFDNLVVG